MLVIAKGWKQNKSIKAGGNGDLFLTARRCDSRANKDDCCMEATHLVLAT